MRNFTIHDADYVEPEPPVRLWDVGTSLTFQTIGNRIKAVYHVPVQFA